MARCAQHWHYRHLAWCTQTRAFWKTECDCHVLAGFLLHWAVGSSSPFNTFRIEPTAFHLVPPLPFLFFPVFDSSFSPPRLLLDRGHFIFGSLNIWRRSAECSRDEWKYFTVQKKATKQRNEIQVPTGTVNFCMWDCTVSQIAAPRWLHLPSQPWCGEERLIIPEKCSRTAAAVGDGHAVSDTNTFPWCGGSNPKRFVFVLFLCN